MQKGTSTASSNQTAEKLLQVMEALARQSQPVKLIDLAHELDMNNSTLYRFLTALQNAGYVTQYKDSGKYAMNLKLCHLSEMIKQNFGVTSALHQALVEISELFQESAHLAQAEDHMIVYTDNVASSAQMLTIRQHIGKRAPMHCTGVGKLFLSEYSAAELDELIALRGLPRYTEYTPTTKEELQARLAQIRSRGYAFDDEECEIGVRCVAVPIRNYTGRIIGGLSVSAPTSRITDAVVEKNLPAMLEIARRASMDLGYSGESIG